MSERARLLELTIRDFAIIESLHIDWATDFGVLTGETGAGKSIVIDALGAALGDRADSTWIRSGADRAFVEAIFSIPASDERLCKLLTELGAADDDLLILSRDVYPGRSVCRVNGRAVPVAVVEQLGQSLVDVHSQAFHLSLLRVREHLETLDRYAGLAPLRAEMAEAARSLRAIRRDVDELEVERRQGEREAVLLRHEVDEIDAAALREGEEEELQAARARLRHAQRLQQLASDAFGALQGSEEAEGAVALLGEAVRRVDEIVSIDPGFVADGRLVELVDAVEDLARELRRYVESIEHEAGGLPEAEERLLMLAGLKRKYGPTPADVMAYRDRAAARLDAVEHHEERLGRLHSQESECLRAATNAAAALSDARAIAARRLETAVVAELEELGMAGSGFVVSLDHRPDPEGVSLGDDTERLAFDETGVDRVEFLIAPNRGEAPRPLARIASGGELARLMLALKSALAAVDQTPVLVFDELDQGVGGRMGHVIGEKLWRVSRLHQVLCITHLPQVAAYARDHYVAGKRVDADRTVATVERLAEGDRVAELTAMLAGPNAGQAARRNAQELLDQVGEWKLGNG